MARTVKRGKSNILSTDTKKRKKVVVNPHSKSRLYIVSRNASHNKLLMEYVKEDARQNYWTQKQNGTNLPSGR